MWLFWSEGMGSSLLAKLLCEHVGIVVSLTERVILGSVYCYASKVAL